MLGFFSAGILFLRLSVSFQHFVLTAMLLNIYTTKHVHPSKEVITKLIVLATKGQQN